MKEEDQVIKTDDARRIVLAIKSGTMETGIKIIQTIAEVAQDKVVSFVKETVNKGK